MTTRREVITLLGGAAAAWPLAALAQQQPRVWRIGVLGGFKSPPYAGFVQGLRDLGYVDGQNVRIEWRFADGIYERIPALAAELVALDVDVIMLGTAAAIQPVRQATTTIPIVMGYSTDPVGHGFVASLARPGGNVTGLASLADDSVPKQFELLATLLSEGSRVGLLGNPTNPTFSAVLKVTQANPRMSIVPVEAARDPQQLDQAFATLAQNSAKGFIAIADGFFFGQRRRIAELALQHGLASMFPQREYVEAGGLLSYGQNLSDFYRRAASYVDKILKGAKPADLPIEQPTRFFLVVNLKTAKALGLDIPPTLLARADEVIE